MRKFLLALISLLLSAAVTSIAQPKYVAKFGRVSLEELKMTHYALDSSANAVILFDKAKLNGLDGTFTRHLRLKILATGGTSFANFHIRTPSKSDINGTTYNLENGQVIETDLKRENIFKEEIVKGFETFKVFFPAVKPGSVIELRYSFSGLPYQWRFQDIIPVMYSEIILEQTNFVQFKKAMYGHIPVRSDDQIRWFAEKVPAFREEPLMTDYSNYLTHFKFDIARIGFYELSTSWEKLAEKLWTFPDFGGVITDAPFLNAKAKEIKSSSGTLMEKINAAYQYIQENIKWNGTPSLIASDHYRENFKTNHTGNAAEVNLLLTSLLRKADIKAYPMAMSTRENGLLNPISASLWSMNYVVCYVKDGETEILLDATSPDLVPGVISPHCRNTNGFVMDKLTGWWVDTTTGKPFSKKQYIQIRLDDSGTFGGEVINTYEDYDYLKWLEKYKAAGSDELFVNSLKAHTTDLEVRQCSLKVDKAKLSAVENIQVDLSGTEYIQDLGNELLINPFLFNDIVNPFKSEKRQYPVDFVSTLKRSITISIKIPDRYAVQRIPESVLLKPECGGAKFSYQAGLSGNMLNVKCMLSIDRQIFTESDYAALRYFYSEVYRKLSEPIQLYKKT
jgi:hypothetical protein